MWKKLGLQGHGVSFLRFLPGDGHPFWHVHQRQEETYICLEGTAVLRVDGQELTLERGDCVRVPAPSVRALGNMSEAPCLVLSTGSMPPREGDFKSGRALIADGSRIRQMGRPDWTRPLAPGEGVLPTEDSDT